MSRSAAIHVIEPGMFTTVQDLGRPGWTQFGVPRGGAADALSLRIGNRLVGNEDGAAGLEMTLVGGAFEFTRELVIALTGGDVEARVEGSGQERAVPMWSAFEIHSGERLVTGPVRSGARTYFCVRGGVQAPMLLGSRSTHPAAAFGGHEGRALRRGDALEVGEGVRSREHHGAAAAEAVRASQFARDVLARRELRAVGGAHMRLFEPSTVEAFWGATFEVSLNADRTGVRLTERIGSGACGGRLPSEGMMHGAVQVPESGEPILLGVDHPTTGGYPVMACVIAADLPILGQLRPRDRVRFVQVDRAEARTLYTTQERRLNAEIPS
ncbi:MAG: KipI antagonist [Planctomycetota bacterium]|nr:MAG: KipI antagonist [Planctomycetota bacterium]